MDIPFPYFKDNDIQRKWCQTFETKNISKNKKVLLEPKDVVQGLDWELIFRIKILRNSTYLGREIVSEELIFNLGLGEDLKHQSSIDNEEILSIYKEKTPTWLSEQMPKYNRVLR